MVRMWQSNAVAAKKALGIAFLDVKSAFYRVVKAMLATFNGSAESLAAVFRDLKLPSNSLPAIPPKCGTVQHDRKGLRFQDHCRACGF